MASPLIRRTEDGDEWFHSWYWPTPHGNQLQHPTGTNYISRRVEGYRRYGHWTLVQPECGAAACIALRCTCSSPSARRGRSSAQKQPGEQSNNGALCNCPDDRSDALPFKRRTSQSNGLVPIMSGTIYVKPAGNQGVVNTYRTVRPPRFVLAVGLEIGP